MVKTLAKSKKQQQPAKFVLDGAAAASEGIFDVSEFEKFLHDRIKVAGRTGNLGSVITIKRSGNNVSVTAAVGTPFAKRYLKYLTKKFLKKKELRDFIRVVSSKKDTYELKYLQVLDESDDEAEDAE
ncbi:MAG: hypothetical protein SGCHY_001606 [Lobulomycetales sp.]